MRFFLLYLIGLLSMPVMASEAPNLSNDREGTTYYNGRSETRAKDRALKQVEGAQILQAFEETLKVTTLANACSYDFNASLAGKLKKINPRFNQLEGVIFHLRSENKFDDITAKILLDANHVTTSGISPKNRGEMILPNDLKVYDEALKIISQFEKKSKTICFDDAYRTLYGDVLRLDKNLTAVHLEGLLYDAFDSKLITPQTYQILEKARANDLHATSLTLKTYHKKKSILRKQFPLRDASEQSEFVTAKAGKQKVSYRQRLYENYSDLQIMLMANVIKKLRVRIESPRAEILIFDRNQNTEVIELEPMERFRLAIKLLRKEMALLSLNTYFSGRSPDYMDLMTSAYEVGFIPAVELETVAGLQDIWNPKKTFWEKADIWIRTFSAVASVALPPPYGFIPALAVVIIEMTTGKDKNNTNSEDPTVLF